jgi:hypothetical protein
MNNITRLARTIVTFVLLVCAGSAFAQSAQRVVYVNGIMTDNATALITAQRIFKILQQSVNHPLNTRTYSVDVVWNPQGWSQTSGSCLLSPADKWYSALYHDFVDATNPDHCLFKDNVEIVMLKASEERYAAKFNSLLHPHDQATSSFSSDDASAVANYADPMYGMNSGNMGLVSYGVANTDPSTTPFPDSMRALKDTIQSLAGAMLWKELDSNGAPTGNTHSTIVVAHSQGNLLANLAYAKASVMQAGSDGVAADPWKYVRIINIANTSEFSLNNLNLTNAADGALFADLRLKNLAKNYNTEASVFGSNMWKRITPQSPDWNTPMNHVLANPTFNDPADGVYPFHADENHLLRETYLGYADEAGWEHNRFVTVSNKQGVTYTSDNQRFRDHFEDLIYQASKSLDDANTPPPPVDPWTVVYRDDFNGFTTDWAFTSAPVQYWSGGNLTFGAKANTTNSATATLNFPVGDGVHKMRIKWRQKISHGSGSYFKYLFDARGSGVNMAVVTDYCSSGNIAYVTNETCRTNQRPRGAIMNQWVNVVMIVSPGVVDVVITNDSGAQIDSFSDFGNHSPVLTSPLFRIGGNDASTSLALDYFEVAIRNQ